MPTAGQLRLVQEHWMELPDVEKRKLLRKLFSAAYVQDNAIRAVQQTENFYPLAKTIHRQEDRFCSGSDGHRTRSKDNVEYLAPAVT